VNLRLAAIGTREAIRLRHFEGDADDPDPARIARRPIYFEKRGFLDASVFDRNRLRPGMIIRGPAVVEESTSVTLIPVDRTATVAADQGLFVNLRGAP
jgi:N-methylhydantoinase A